MKRTVYDVGAVPTRRQFLIGGGAAIGLVVAAVALPTGAMGQRDGREGDTRLNSWVRIAPDGSVEITCGRSEMGQGIHTGLATLVAEELGCRWQDISVTTGPDQAFKNIAGGRQVLSHNAGFAVAEEDAGWFLTKLARVATEQFTGGSTGIPDGFVRAREAGAMARVLLLAEAAAEWGVPPVDCIVKDGQAIHIATGRTLGFGALAAGASRREMPDTVSLKPRAEWTLIGTTPPRVDIPLKVDGSAVFAGDIRLPGLVYAAIKNAPTLGSALLAFDTATVLSMRGVRRVLAVPGGVAVVADTTWHARQALSALPATWSIASDPTLDSAGIDRTLSQALDGPSKRASARGDIDAAFAGAAQVVSAEYRLPYLAHVTMEPMACTAHLDASGILTVWAPTQLQTRALSTAADAAGIDKDNVRLHTTYLGGGFGRRGEVDHIAQVATLAAALKRPVQASWSREEEMRHDFYRPAAVTRLEAAVAADGTIKGWRQRVATQSIMARLFPPATWLGPDKTMLEGGDDMAYAIPATRMDYATVDLPVPIGPWRSVGHSLHGFFVESFLDEVAAAGGHDPLALRRVLLSGEPRMLALLGLVAEKAGWGTPLPSGRGRGIAIHRSFNSAVAQVVEVEVDGPKLRILRVVAAADCGTLINPGIVEAQVMSAIADGLSAALYGEITIGKAAIVQGNFDAYEMLRLAQMPEVEVCLVENQEPPGGIGEPGLPPVAPALANAIFAATGHRIRRLPLVREGFEV